MLMLITRKGEAPAIQSRRQKAIVTACEFLLADTAFERAAVSVVEVDSKKPGAQTIRNYEVRRAQFQTAVKKGSKTGTLKEGLSKARGHESVAKAICAELGVK